MMSTVATDKVKSPFSRSERKQLMAWSKLTKNEKLLNGFQRKVLYEAGHYNFIFISRLHRLMQTLKELATQLGEDQEDTVIELQNIGYSCYLKVQAHAGYPELQFMYGEALYYGLYDLEENELEALQWVIKSANQKNVDAQFCLHNCEIW